MALTPGTEVVLQSWTQQQIPQCALEWNGIINPPLIGSHYYVVNTTPITCNGSTYQIVDLTPRDAGNPGIQWPELALKLALPHL